MAMILERAIQQKCRIIFCGTAAACQSFVSGNCFFLRSAPIFLNMPVLSSTELAKISLQVIEQRGYKLSTAKIGSVSIAGQLKAMSSIVSQN